MPDLESLGPSDLMPIFLEICAIPHPSHHEEAIAAWALARALRQGFSARQDTAGNVIIRKPARPGREKAPGIILQAHLDMVPQKTSSSSHDFLRDPIRPWIDPADPAWLRATGTTLGADNGIGVAAGFSLLEDPDLVHGPLELLLTVNEEDGMEGAQRLEPGSLQGRLLINLDGEREDELCVGSAGGMRIGFTFEERAGAVPPGRAWLSVALSGLLGGHSGVDIQRGRANAIRVLLGFLIPEAGPELRLGALCGGSLPNAIPREAGALVGLPAAAIPALRSRLEARAADTGAAFRATDPGLRLELAAAEAPATSLDPAATARILGALAAMPDGLQSMLEGIPEVARLSSNLGALAMKPSGEPRGKPGLRIEGLILVRGAFDTEKASLVEKHRAALEAGGATIETRSGTSAWPPDLSSPLLAVAKGVWREAWGREPLVRATHGGLECSLFRPVYPGWDMLSIGSTIRFTHSPDEAVDIASIGRFRAAARRLVEELAT